MANVSFSLGPIHLTVTYINFPVSTYLLHFGSHSTILWSEVPSSDIVTGGVYTYTMLVHILSKVAWPRVTTSTT